ncbi:MAG: hypothetical protein ACRDGL_01075 [Candidatus Limnocylindrales bacterium]
MIPLLLLLVGLACLAGGLGLLRWLGPRLRVARLLAVTPSVSIPEALELASRAEPRYVLVRGRITSDEEFPDEFDRPLVYRRRRLEIRPPGSSGGPWRTVEDEREAVPFGVEERGAFIGVDAAGLDEGLVVLSREAEGPAGEVPDRMPAGTDPAATVRHRILQVSAVEHADVAGQPTIGPDGSPVMAAGLGRPLILSTLERGEAMRVIAGGRQRRVALAGGLLAGGLVLVAAGLALGILGLLSSGPVLAPASAASTSATPSSAPSPSAGTATGDTRSSGEGVGLVGEPFLALFGVLALGLVTVGGTTLLVYIARRR